MRCRIITSATFQNKGISALTKSKPGVFISFNSLIAFFTSEKRVNWRSSVWIKVMIEHLLNVHLVWGVFKMLYKGWCFLMVAIWYLVALFRWVFVLWYRKCCHLSLSLRFSYYFKVLTPSTISSCLLKCFWFCSFSRLCVFLELVEITLVTVVFATVAQKVESTFVGGSGFRGFSWLEG